MCQFYSKYLEKFDTNVTHREKCLLLNIVQGMSGWLLLNFFVSLHNQLRSLYTFHYYISRIQIF